MRFKYALLAPLFIATAVVAQTSNGPSIEIGKENHTLTVSSVGHAEAEAEIAEISVGYTVYGATLPAAYKSASGTSNAIVKAMLDAGAKQTEIQSQLQNVARLQDDEIKVQHGMKFSVRQSWTVSVAPKDAALILDAAIQAGANQSGSINWRMKDSTALDDEAIRRATERAHEMAAEMAKSMGVKLGKPLYATNSFDPVLVNGLQADKFSGGGLEQLGYGPLALAVPSQHVASTANIQIIYSIE